MPHQTLTLDEIKSRPLEEWLREIADRGLVATIQLPDGRTLVLAKEQSLGTDARAAIQREKNQAALRLLESWETEDEEDPREQQETWEMLKKALDEDRLSERKLFP